MGKLLRMSRLYLLVALAAVGLALWTHTPLVAVLPYDVAWSLGYAMRSAGHWFTGS